MKTVINIENEKSITIEDCPTMHDADEMIIDLSEEYSDVVIYCMRITYTKNGVTVHETYTEGEQASLVDAFVAYPMVLINRLLEVRSILGFLPFHQSGKYVAHLDFDSMETLAKRVLPHTMSTFLGVEIPTAFLGELSAKYTGNDLLLAMNNGVAGEHVFEEIQYNHLIENDLRKVITIVLAKIADRKTRLNLTDMVIFKCLGWLDLIDRSLFIHGDKFVEDGIGNRVLCGNLNPQLWDFTVDFSGIDLRTVPDEFIKFTKEFKNVVRKYRNHKTDAEMDAETRAMEVYFRNLQNLQ